MLHCGVEDESNPGLRSDYQIIRLSDYPGTARPVTLLEGLTLPLTPDTPAGDDLTQGRPEGLEGSYDPTRVPAIRLR
jgi:hypothetical protein